MEELGRGGERSGCGVVGGRREECGEWRSLVELVQQDLCKRKGQIKHNQREINKIVRKNVYMKGSYE